MHKMREGEMSWYFKRKMIKNLTRQADLICDRIEVIPDLSAEYLSRMREASMAHLDRARQTFCKCDDCMDFFQKEAAKSLREKLIWERDFLRKQISAWEVE